MVRSTLLLLLLPWSLLAAPVRAQDRPDLDDQLKAYTKLLKGKGHEDEIIGTIDRLLSRYKADGERRREIAEALELEEGDLKALRQEDKDLEREQALLVKAVWQAFALRKRPTEANRRLWVAMAYALGQMGPDGADYLWKAFADKRVSRDYEFQALCVEQVGMTRDWDQWKKLVDQLDYRDELVAAAAGKALVHFRDAPGRIRRECTERLVKLLEARHNAATNIDDTYSIRVYRTVRQPWLQALSALTGQSFTDPLDWVKWWNDNKNRASAWPDPS